VQKADSELAQALRDVAALTPYAVEIRYPSQGPPVTLEDARQAVQLAEKTRDAVLSALQPDCEDLSL
jgi:hypothetical protein